MLDTQVLSCQIRRSTTLGAIEHCTAKLTPCHALFSLSRTLYSYTTVTATGRIIAICSSKQYLDYCLSIPYTKIPSSVLKVDLSCSERWIRNWWPKFIFHSSMFFTYQTITAQFLNKFFRLEIHSLAPGLPRPITKQQWHAKSQYW